MDHCTGCHTCAFTVAYAVFWFEVLFHYSAVKFFHIRGAAKERGGGLPYSFLKIKKDTLVLEKKRPWFCPTWGLLKHPNFKKSHLPWTISSCAPAYIWYKQSDFCSLELYWQYLQKSWWSSSIIPKKVTWVLFPARINTLYSKLPPINDLFLNSLFAIDVLAEYQIRKFFSAMLHQNIVRQNKFLKFSPNFLHLLCWFCHCNNNSISGETCKVVNW